MFVLSNVFYVVYADLMYQIFIGLRVFICLQMLHFGLENNLTPALLC